MLISEHCVDMQLQFVLRIAARSNRNESHHSVTVVSVVPWTGSLSNCFIKARGIRSG